MGFLKGKTAIITGGGRAVLSDGSCGSIGYGIATAYAKRGGKPRDYRTKSAEIRRCERRVRKTLWHSGTSSAGRC